MLDALLRGANLDCCVLVVFEVDVLLSPGEGYESVGNLSLRLLLLLLGDLNRLLS